jgi:hypothetical protein
MKSLLHFTAASTSALLYAQMSPLTIEFLLRVSNAILGFPKVYFSTCTGEVYPNDYSLWQFWWFISWLSAYLICAYARCYRQTTSRPTFLQHLRYGPMVAFAVYLLLVPLAEWEVIERSKGKIRDYMEDGSSAGFEPYRDLYVRGVLNYSYEFHPPEYELYAETAAEGLHSDHPMVRVRALKMSHFFYNQAANPWRSPFIRALSRSRHDSDPIFREEANELIRQLRTECAQKNSLNCQMTLKALDGEP